MIKVNMIMIKVVMMIMVMMVEIKMSDMFMMTIKSVVGESNEEDSLLSFL